MAIFRCVSPNFWSDPKVDDDFTPEDKYFYLYLLTNPHTTLSGCYELGSNRTAVEVVANHISFAGSKAAEKPAVHDFDQQTKNYTNEAKAAQNAPQGQQYAQGDADDFIDVTDDGDLPF